jgi:CheY-like chemotaxis protein
MMGGKIWVTSALGEGSVFSFTALFDVVQDTSKAAPGTWASLLAEESTLDPEVDAATKQNTNSTPLPGQVEYPDLSAYTILLAEDIDINREIVEALLEPTGVHFVEATDGNKAIELFKSEPRRYALVLMDMQMPHVDGLDATRAIRAYREVEPWAGEVPIIAMTANVFKDDIDRCLNAGMNAHIGKPLEVSELVMILKEYL